MKHQFNISITYNQKQNETLQRWTSWNIGKLQHHGNQTKKQDQSGKHGNNTSKIMDSSKQTNMKQRQLENRKTRTHEHRKTGNHEFRKTRIQTNRT